MRKLLIAMTALITPFVATLTHANDAALLDEARKVSMMLPPKLLVALKEEMSKSGPEGAIPVCKDMAPKMAGEMSQQTGWKITTFLRAANLGDTDSRDPGFFHLPRLGGCRDMEAVRHVCGSLHRRYVEPWCNSHGIAH